MALSRHAFTRHIRPARKPMFSVPGPTLSSEVAERLRILDIRKRESIGKEEGRLLYRGRELEINIELGICGR